MISAVAITMALAFWAPYNNSGQPVCASGVKIQAVGAYGSPGSVPGPTFVRTDGGQLTRHCQMYADPAILKQTHAVQCAWVARNVGASWFGLPASSDPTNVMSATTFVMPATCNKLTTRWERHWAAMEKRAPHKR